MQLFALAIYLPHNINIMDYADCVLPVLQKRSEIQVHYWSFADFAAQVYLNAREKKTTIEELDQLSRILLTLAKKLPEKPYYVSSEHNQTKILFKKNDFVEVISSYFVSEKSASIKDILQLACERCLPFYQSDFDDLKWKRREKSYSDMPRIMAKIIESAAQNIFNVGSSASPGKLLKRSQARQL